MNVEPHIYLQTDIDVEKKDLSVAKQQVFTPHFTAFSLASNSNLS